MTQNRGVRVSTGARATRRASYRKQHPLSDDEREAIRVAVRSAFLKLKKLYASIVPIFDDFGFRPPSAGAIARDLSEKIESSIVQHCDSFQKGARFADLERQGRDWEVKICKGSGLTINQSKHVDGETYIVVNYVDGPAVSCVWVLWEAEDRFFSERRTNSNARTINAEAANRNVEVLIERPARGRARPNGAQ